MFHVPEQYRYTLGGPYTSTIADGNNGKFLIKYSKFPHVLICLASDGMEWEHVSVSTRKRCPTWKEMCYIKNLFWDKSDCVIQYHPPEKNYINYHPFCLHLWRPIKQKIIMPPVEMV